jgi:hypothetical protein
VPRRWRRAFYEKQKRSRLRLVRPSPTSCARPVQSRPDGSPLLLCCRPPPGRTLSNCGPRSRSGGATEPVDPVRVHGSAKRSMPSWRMPRRSADFFGMLLMLIILPVDSLCALLGCIKSRPLHAIPLFNLPCALDSAKYRVRLSRHHPHSGDAWSEVRPTGTVMLLQVASMYPPTYRNICMS